MGRRLRAACNGRMVPVYFSSWLAVLYYMTILGGRKFIMPSHLFGPSAHRALL
jgi:hypothetical protein